MKLFDLHCDTLVTLGEKKADFFCPETQFSLCELEKFRCFCQTMAIFIPDQVRGEDAFAYFLKYKEYLDQLLQRQAEVVGKNQLWSRYQTNYRARKVCGNFGGRKWCGAWRKDRTYR